MAVYCELQDVVHHLRFKTQSFYEALKRDAIAEQLYTPESPDNEVYFSRSLEKEPQIAILQSQMKQQQDIHNNKTNENKSPTKKPIKNILWERPPPNAPHLHMFAKEDVPKTIPQVSSQLTKSIKPESADKKDAFAEYGDVRIEPPGGMVLTVHTWVPTQPPLAPRVIEKSSVGQVIAVVLRMYAQQRREPAAVMDPKAYLLRIADESGKADEDYPALDEKQVIYKFKDEHFVLCRNIKHLPPSTSPPQTPGSAPLVIKVHYPDHSSAKILVSLDMKIGELTKIVARRRQYNDADHFLRLPYAETPCDVNITIEQLGVDELTLSNKSLLRQSPEEPSEVNGERKKTHEKRKSTNTNNAPPALPVKEEDRIFWYDTLAFAFKSYEVIKVKKYVKKEITLGVDRDRIAHMSQQKRDSTKNKSRMIRDVARVTLLEKPRQLVIEYTDGKSYTYEAKSPGEAREIVEKIEYLVTTEQNIHKA